MVLEYANTLKESNNFKMLLLREVAVIKNSLLELDESLLEEIADTIDKYSDNLIKESVSDNYQVVISCNDYLTESDQTPFFWGNSDHVMFNEKCLCVYNDNLKEFYFYKVEESAKLSEGERIDRFKGKVSNSWNKMKAGTRGAIVGATLLGAGLGVQHAMDSYNPTNQNQNQIVRQAYMPKEKAEKTYEIKVNRAVKFINTEMAKEGNSIAKKDLGNIEAELNLLHGQLDKDRSVNPKDKEDLHNLLDTEIERAMDKFESNLGFIDKYNPF
jgi:hypothetical protein